MLERIFTRRGPTVQRTGTSAITAGLLLFASVFAEYLFSAENDGKVTNVAILSLYIAGFVAGTAALIVALNGLRVLPAHASLRRAGRVGFWTAIGGATLLLLFALQALVSTAATGNEPGGFVLFGLGFLLLVGGRSQRPYRGSGRSAGLDSRIHRWNRPLLRALLVPGAESTRSCHRTAHDAPCPSTPRARSLPGPTGPALGRSEGGRPGGLPPSLGW